MIRLICPLLLISTILWASLHADTNATKTPAPAKSFPFAPPGTIKAGAYDVKLHTRMELVANNVANNMDSGDPDIARASAIVNIQCEYAVTVAPANKKQEQVLELTYHRVRDSMKEVVLTTDGDTEETIRSFDSRHPKQAKGMKCIEKRMGIVGKKARWTICKGALANSDGFEQLHCKAEPPVDKEGEYDEAAWEAFNEAMSANTLIDSGAALFPQYTRSLLPVKSAKVGDTWKRKADVSSWFRGSTNDTPIPAKVTCTLSKIEGTIATVTFSFEIPPCTQTTNGETSFITGTDKKGEGSFQYDHATELVISEHSSFTAKTATQKTDGQITILPLTVQFQRTITITPKKAKTKAKPAPTKKPAN